MEQLQFEFCGFGVEVHSQRPLSPDEDLKKFLRPGGRRDVLLTCTEVEDLTPEGTLLGGGMEWQAFRTEQGVERFSLAGGHPYACLTYIPEATERAVLRIKASEWSWVTRGLRFWITACFPILLLRFRALLLHASYIEYGGEGILFTAPSQTGKSTQAELWRRYRGAEVRNGDKAAVSLRERPVVHGVPFSGTSGICQNVSLPLRAVVVLSQARENTVRRLSPSQVVSSLIGNCFVDHAVPEDWSAALNLLLDLAASVPVYALACTPDVRAVETLEQALYGEEGEQ